MDQIKRWKEQINQKQKINAPNLTLARCLDERVTECVCFFDRFRSLYASGNLTKTKGIVIHASC